MIEMMTGGGYGQRPWRGHCRVENTGDRLPEGLRTDEIAVTEIRCDNPMPDN